jgi:hypothetical protein
MTQLTHTQYCNNRVAHKNASMSNLEITYKGKVYTYKEFNAAYPVEDVVLTEASKLKRESKKKK